jgi:nucleotide-binding universal stress UspA family protein
MPEKSRVILVPIDANDQALIALSQSYNFARLTKCKIVLLRIDDGNAPDIQAKIDMLAKEATEKSGMPVETIIRKGKNIYEEITKVADEINPKLIIVGINRIDSGNFRGKNALEMIRKSQHPIISIGGKSHRDGCKTILMPLDLTILSREKIPGVIEVAKLFGADIQIVSILTTESKLEENKLHMYANQCLKFIRENGIKCGVKFIRTQGDIADAALEYGKQIDADLIVIVSNKDRSIKEFFTGTAAQRLINNSDIPVLTLRPMERRDTSTSQPVF